MERFKYWIKNIMGKGDNYCRSFCPGCKYFEICKADKSEQESVINYEARE